MAELVLKEPERTRRADRQAPLLEVKDLRTHFFLAQGIVRAVDGVDLVVQRGQTVGIVGESGCGKSVMARSILRIVPPPGRVVDGQILFDYEAGEARLSSSAIGAPVDRIDLAKL